MWRPSRSLGKGCGTLLAGLVASGALWAFMPSAAMALPLPDWASSRIIAAAETRLPFTITAAEGFSIALGPTIETLTIGIERMGISDPVTGISVELDDAALAVGFLDLLIGSVVVESITVGRLDWRQGTALPASVERFAGVRRAAMPDIRSLTRQLARFEGTLERLVVENFATEHLLPGSATPLNLEGRFQLANSAEGWLGDFMAVARWGASRIGSASGELAVAKAGDVPEIEVTIAADTSTLGPALDLPLAIPFLQIGATLTPTWGPTGQLASIAIALDGTGDASASDDPLAIASLVMNGVWRPGDAALEIEHLALESHGARLAGHGTTLLEVAESGGVRGVSGSALIETLEVNFDRLLEESLPPIAGSLTYAFDLAGSQKNFAEFQFASPVTGGHVHYAAGEGGRSEVLVNVDVLTVEELIAFWPADLFANTRRWLANAVADGRMQDFTGLFSIPAEGTVKSLITFQFADLDFTPIRGHLPVTAGKGHAELSEEEMQIVFSEGWVDVPDKGLIDLGASHIHIPKIRDASHPSVIHVNFTGDLSAVLDLLDQKPFAFMTKVNMSPDIATGAVEGAVEVRIPLLDTVQVNDITVTVNAVIKDLVAYGLWPGQAIRANYAAVNADEHQINIAGEAFAGEVLTNVDWHLVYDGSEHSVAGTVRLDEKFFAQLNARYLASSVSGDERATFLIDLNTPGAIPFQLTSPLTGLQVAIPEIGWRKPEGVAVDFQVSGQLAPTITVDQIRLKSPDLDFAGSLRLEAKTGRLERISLASARLGRAYTGPAELVMGASGRLTRIAMPGMLVIGALEADVTRPAAGDQQPLDVSIGTIVFSETIHITNANGQFGGLEEYDGRLKANLNNAVPIRIGIERRENGARLVINADDAGAVAREMGLTGNLAGGKLAMDLTAQPDRGVYEGNLHVTDVTARKIPVLLSLLSAIALTGLIDQMDSGGISFPEVRSQFTVTPQTVTIRNGIANSSSIGLTAEGTYDISGKTMDFAGSLTPNIYIGFALNTILPIGRLVGQREGEGLGTIRYTLRGPVGKPLIQTNALSILSPIGSGDLDTDN